MSAHLVPMSGTFGRLTITGHAGTARSGALWHATCSCGQTVTTVGSHLRRGNVKSCGCLRREGHRRTAA
jgi:hypothetical protein